MLATFFTQAKSQTRVPGTNLYIPVDLKLKDISFWQMVGAILFTLFGLLISPFYLIGLALKATIGIPVGWTFFKLRKALTGV